MPKKTRKRKELSRFYAVTQTSIYQVNAWYGRTRPFAIKIAKRESSQLFVGDKLGRGRMIAIGSGLIVYIPEPFRLEVEKVSIRSWRGSSSDIVGLFLTRNAARNCAAHSDLGLWDKRWRNSTMKVLRWIGPKHSSFYICRFVREKFGLEFAA